MELVKSKVLIVFVVILMGVTLISSINNSKQHKKFENVYTQIN